MADPLPSYNPDTFLWYSSWFAKFYGRPLGITREQWNAWCAQPRGKAIESDIDHDYRKEREGDAQ